MIQTSASIVVSVAAALVLIATCRRRPHRWYLSGGTFFAIYAVLQGIVVGLVIATARKLEDGERKARGWLALGVGCTDRWESPALGAR